MTTYAQRKPRHTITTSTPAIQTEEVDPVENYVDTVAKPLYDRISDQTAEIARLRAALTASLTSTFLGSKWVKLSDEDLDYIEAQAQKEGIQPDAYLAGLIQADRAETDEEDNCPRAYILTDGAVDTRGYPIRYMTAPELEEAQRQAKEETGGNWQWLPCNTDEPPF